VIALVAHLRFDQAFAIAEADRAGGREVHPPAVAGVPGRPGVAAGFGGELGLVLFPEQFADRGDEQRIARHGLGGGKRKSFWRSIRPVSRSAPAKAGQATRRDRKSMLVVTPAT
jgi:hypothetical protein